MLPNFLVIGTYRAGTTWLHEVLKRHPDVYLPAEKEVMFFSRYYDKGLAWYESFYDGWNGQKAVGEISPGYLADDDAPDRIARDLPGAKLIAIVRRPVDQVMSHYQLRLQRGLTANAIEQEMEAYPRLLNAALYYRNLERYRSSLDAGRLTVLFYDDLVRDPHEFLRAVYRTLELPDFIPPQAGLRENASGAIRSEVVEKLASGVADLLRRHSLLKLKVLLGRTGIPKRIKRLNTGRKRETTVPLAVRRRIAQATEEDRRQLGQLTGRDLSQWL